MRTSLRNRLENLVAAPVQWDCPLSGYTSFGVGGPAEALVIVEDREELRRLLSFFKENKIAWRVVGKGTNLLVGDAGFPGVVLILGRGFYTLIFSEEEAVGRVHVKVGAAYGLTKLVRRCVEAGCSGLEFAAGIPGTAGGAVIMNAGAWGGAMADVVRVVETIAAGGEKRFAAEELEFGYRCWGNRPNSSADPWVVTGVLLELHRADPREMRKICAGYLRERKKKQPHNLPCAGSFFKNPPHDSAGRLIEAAGFKGRRAGGAMVSPKHANFIVNTGRATAADILELMRLIQDRVKRDADVYLEPEVDIL